MFLSLSVFLIFQVSFQACPDPSPQVGTSHFLLWAGPGCIWASGRVGSRCLDTVKTLSCSKFLATLCHSAPFSWGLISLSGKQACPGFPVMEFIQDTLPQDMPPWHTEYLKLKELKNKKQKNDRSRKVTLTPSTFILLP